MGLPIIECSVVFLSTAEGGRSTPFPRGVLSGDSYRPHIVIGDPHQREAIREGNRLVEEFLGVTFHTGPDNLEIGKEMRVELILLFYPHPAYDRLKSGVTFTVREGSRIVAYGSVVSGV